MARKWPDKNPESKHFSLLDSPMSTDAPKADPRPGINSSDTPDNASPRNPVGYPGVDGGKSK